MIFGIVVPAAIFIEFSQIRREFSPQGHDHFGFGGPFITGRQRDAGFLVLQAFPPNLKPLERQLGDQG